MSDWLSEHAAELVIAIVLAFLAAELLEALNWLARRIVRWAAYATFPDDLEEARDVAEEWQAEIAGAPLKTVALWKASRIGGAAARIAFVRRLTVFTASLAGTVRHRLVAAVSRHSNRLLGKLDAASAFVARASKWLGPTLESSAFKMGFATVPIFALTLMVTVSNTFRLSSTLISLALFIPLSGLLSLTFRPYATRLVRRMRMRRQRGKKTEK